MLHIKINILSWYLRLFLTAWNGGRGKKWGFEVGSSPSAAVILPSGSILSHSSCNVYTYSTYSVVNSLMCHSVTIFEDNHLVDKLLKRRSMNPESSLARVQWWGDTLKWENPLLWVRSVGPCFCKTAVESSFQAVDWGTFWKGISSGGGIRTYGWGASDTQHWCANLSSAMPLHG